MQNAKEEYETSFSLNINSNIAESIWNKNLPVCSYFILYFRDATRCSNNVFQKKVYIKREKFLKILKNKYFIPCERKASIETLAEKTCEFHALTTIIFREVLYESSDPVSQRICLESVTDENGTNYYLTGEVEYSLAVFKNYTELTQIENNFFTTFLQEFKYILDLINFSENIFDDLEPHLLISLPCRRFHKFYEKRFNPKECFLKYKFDGYKGKLYITRGSKKAFYFDDLYQLQEIDTVTECLKSFGGVSFQLEILSESRLAIITDVLGVNVESKLFRPEPLEAVRFLESLGINNNTNYQLQIGRETYLLCTQFIIPEEIQQFPASNQTCLNQILFDGLIVISGNREYKFKIPTIDVTIEHRESVQYLNIINNGITRRIGRCIFNLSEQRTDDINHIQPIYEAYRPLLSDRKSNLYIILRRRYDRVFTASNQDYDSFMKEFNFLENIFIKGKISSERGFLSQPQ